VLEAKLGEKANGGTVKILDSDK